MNKTERSSVRKAGMAPGTLVYTGRYTDKPTLITRTDYSADTFTAKSNVTAEEAFQPFVAGQVTWVHISGLNNIELVARAGKRFGIHPLLLEDILNVNQQPKVVEHGPLLFVTLKDIVFDKKTGQMEPEHMSLILGEGFMVSFREKAGGLVDYISERLSDAPQLRTRGADYLLYLICDRVVDRYFLVLENFENQVEEMEEALLNKPEDFKAGDLLQLRKQSSMVRRQVNPLMEEFRTLAVSDISLIPESTRIYMRDVFDHLLQVSHTMENFRETFSSLLDFYVSQSDLRMNQIMKRLTVLATVFMPLSFITGFYGMNFPNIPELHTLWGYPAAVAVMLLTTTGMIWWLRRGKF